MSSALLQGYPRKRPAAASDVPPAAATLARVAPGPGSRLVDWPVGLRQRAARARALSLRRSRGRA
eukprot:7175916-Pyramimonas_sp.AAC.1